MKMVKPNEIESISEANVQKSTDCIHCWTEV